MLDIARRKKKKGTRNLQWKKTIEVGGVENGVSIVRRGLIPLMCCSGRLCEPPLIRWVWREGRLLVVSTVDVPIVDMLGEVPHVVHPAVNVTHPFVHVMHVWVA
jgi:hypothetical protein